MGVKEAKPVHVWQLTEDKLVATVCINAESGTCTESLRQSVKRYLEEDLNIHLVTVEVIGDVRDSIANHVGPGANDENLAGFINSTSGKGG